jgi:hypothetical protein
VSQEVIQLGYGKTRAADALNLFHKLERGSAGFDAWLALWERIDPADGLDGQVVAQREFGGPGQARVAVQARMVG